jgi:hypothetical protein
VNVTKAIAELDECNKTNEKEEFNYMEKKSVFLSNNLLGDKLEGIPCYKEHGVLNGFAKSNETKKSWITHPVIQDDGVVEESDTPEISMVEKLEIRKKICKEIDEAANYLSTSNKDR